MIFLSCLSLSCQAFATSTAGDCKVNDGNAIVVWTQFDDINGYLHVYGAKGDVTANSSTWAVQEISVDTGGSFYITEPRLFICEATGDALALWQYYDDNTGLLRVGGATVPAASTTWTSHLVSDSTNQQGVSAFDGQASVDASGNGIVTWTAYNLTTSDYDVLGATVAISGSPTWSSSFVLPGGTTPLMAKKTPYAAAKPKDGPKVSPPHPLHERKPPVKMGKRK